MTPFYIKRSSLALKMNRTKKVQTERLKSEHKCVRFAKPNVWFSDIHCTISSLEVHISCSIYSYLLYTFSITLINSIVQQSEANFGTN